VWLPYTCKTLAKDRLRLVCIFLFMSVSLWTQCTAGSGESGVVLLLPRDLGFVLGLAEKSSCHIRVSKKQLGQVLDPGKHGVWL